VSELVIAFDVGGTNTRARVAVVAGVGEPLLAVPDITRCVASARELREFVSQVAATAGRLGTVTAAVVAVAGPVVGERIRLTNWPSDTAITLDELEAAGLPSGRTQLINDAVAGAWGAGARLSSAGPAGGTHPLNTVPGGAAALREGNIVYVAPGTGLGEAVLVRHGLGPHDATVVAGEFQHTQIPCFEGETGRVVDALAVALGRAPDWEDLVSGRGLVRTYYALCAIAAAEPLVITGDDAKRAGGIADAARAGTDAQALAASNVFYRVLGRFAQTLALAFLPCAAVVIGGASTERNLELLRRGRLTQRFTEHHRFGDLLGEVPLHAVGGEVNLEGGVWLAARR